MGRPGFTCTDPEPSGLNEVVEVGELKLRNGKKKTDLFKEYFLVVAILDCGRPGVHLWCGISLWGHDVPLGAESLDGVRCVV